MARGDIHDLAANGRQIRLLGNQLVATAQRGQSALPISSFDHVYVFSAAPGIQITVLRQGEHELASTANLLDLNAVVVQVIHDDGRGLVLLIAVTQSAATEHGTARAPREHVSLVAESRRVVVAADNLLDGESLQRGYKRGLGHLHIITQRGVAHHRRGPNRTHTSRCFPTYTHDHPLL